MKIKYTLWIWLACLIGGGGCSDDDGRLTPTDFDEYHPIIPQGNHEYDERIVEWFERTGTYILYKFKPAEVYSVPNRDWEEIYVDTTKTVERYVLSENDYVEDGVVYLTGVPYPLGKTRISDISWKEITLENTTLLVEIFSTKYGGNFWIEEADEAYVNEQLEMVESIFLNFYSNEILRKKLPLKIILGKNLLQNTGGKQKLNPQPYIATNGNLSLLINYGDESIETVDRLSIKYNLNYWFISEVLELGPSNTDDFYSVSDYYWAGTSTGANRPTNAQTYAAGFVVRPSASTDLLAIQEYDKQYYIRMILQTPYERLIAKPETPDYNVKDFTGILHPDKDVNGLIRKKYDLLIRDFKNFGIDLQAIGDYNN